MYFRLFYILASFYNNMNKILVKKLNIFVIIYYDNIFIYIENRNQDYIIFIY